MSTSVRHERIEFPARTGGRTLMQQGVHVTLKQQSGCLRAAAENDLGPRSAALVTELLRELEHGHLERAAGWYGTYEPDRRRLQSGRVVATWSADYRLNGDREQAHALDDYSGQPHPVRKVLVDVDAIVVPARLRVAKRDVVRQDHRTHRERLRRFLPITAVLRHYRTR